MVSCAAMATIARGSMPAEAASVTNVAPSPASGLPARLSIASMPAASVGAMHDMVPTTPTSGSSAGAIAGTAAARAAAPAIVAIRCRARIGVSVGQGSPESGERPSHRLR